MKKFTQFNNVNESKAVELTLEEKISKLVETLNLEIEGEEKPWEKNISIKTSTEFVNGIKKLITETYLKERLTLLEKAQNSHFTGDVTWISDEIDQIREKLK